MKINIKGLPQSLTDEILIINTEDYFQKELTLEELIVITFNDWDKVKSHFKKDFRFFESLLFKLHFKRRKDYLWKERYHILKFLIVGYYYSKDVRYFNEFLFFFRKNEENILLWNFAVDCFNKNTDISNYHTFPLSSRDGVISWIDQANVTTNLKQISEAKRIGLIGTPIFFNKIKKELINLGFHVNVYFIPFHVDKKINFLLNNKILWFFIKKIVKVPKYTLLDYPIDSHKIKENILSDKNEIGFHKLGFIIRENIYGAFPKGLLNDHWGVLPFIRGYSSIEYSLLFGFPVTATTHLIEKSIDTGAIIKIFKYKADDLKTIRSIKCRIKEGLTNRAVQSIYTYALSDGKVIINDLNRGLTYYSMHVLLRNYIEQNILRKKFVKVFKPKSTF